MIVVIDYVKGYMCKLVGELELEFRASDPKFYVLSIMSHLPLFIDVTHARKH